MGSVEFIWTMFHVVSRNTQVEPGVWEFDGTLNVKAGSTIKIIGQVSGEISLLV